MLNASATVYAYSRKGDTASETVSAAYTIKEIVMDDPSITGITISYALNGNNGRSILPNEGRELMNERGVTELKILGFNATVTGNVTELFMDYAVFPENQSGAQHEWIQAFASLQEDGTWAFSGSAIDWLHGLQSKLIWNKENKISLLKLLLGNIL